MYRGVKRRPLRSRPQRRKNQERYRNINGKRERKREISGRFRVTTVANRSHRRPASPLSTTPVPLSVRAARFVGDPIFRRHRPTPGLFHLLFTGRWFLKESLRNNYYRGQSLARIQRNRLFQERSKRARLSSVSRLLLSRRREKERELKGGGKNRGSRREGCREERGSGRI